MAYVGNTPTTQSFISGTDYFNGDGATIAFTLSRAVVSVNDIEAVVNNVVQQPNTAYTISGTTITFTSAPSAGTSNIYVRYLSTTTQAITPSQGTVSYQSFNSDNQSKLGISFKNRIINGAMVIFQRGTAATSDGQYCVDRWKLVKSNDGTESLSQNSDAPAGFVNSLRNTISTGDSSIGAAQYSGIEQPIEGFNVADLGWGTANAKTVTLSFWVRSSVVGQYTGNLRNATATRICPFNYTVSTANTWEYKTVTIAGDTTGTWYTDNSIGISLALYAALGSNYIGGINGAWGTTPNFGCGSPVNGIASNGNIFAITGVQLEVGTQATTFDYRSIGTELALCQRYYQKINSTANAYGMLIPVAYVQGSTTLNAAVYLPVPMRTTLSSIDYASTTWRRYDGTVSALSNVAFDSATVTNQSALITATLASSQTAGIIGSVIQNNSTSGYVAFSAEL